MPGIPDAPALPPKVVPTRGPVPARGTAPTAAGFRNTGGVAVGVTVAVLLGVPPVVAGSLPGGPAVLNVGRAATDGGGLKTEEPGWKDELPGLRMGGPGARALAACPVAEEEKVGRGLAA